jgi:L-seryl-tRNA(Ser) seleniumtransferase
MTEAHEFTAAFAAHATAETGHDSYGNAFAPGLPYARGAIMRTTQDDLAKLRRAWRLLERQIREQGPESVFNLTGLERRQTVGEDELPYLDDELAPAIYGERLTRLALDHLGGNAAHDAAVFNRLTAALVAAHLVLVRPGDTVVGISAGYSHPSVTRATALAGARFVETHTPEELSDALDREDRVALVVLTRLAVTYELLPAEWLPEIVDLAHTCGAKVLIDDAGGARVGPAVFHQPRSLELGADLAATGLDKYGTIGPRLGLLAGDAELVGAARARAFELGLEARPMLYPAVVRSLEQYDPGRVRALVECTRDVAQALRQRIGDRVHETPVSAQLRGEDTLALALERGGLSEPAVVPYEATAALAMLLLRDHAILTVHFAGLPPGTSALLMKFLAPEVVSRLGGSGRLAEAVDDSMTALSGIIDDPGAISSLLFED